MEKKQYGIGIIGAGFMGKTHTYNYVNIPLFYDGLPFKTKLVGICNRTLSKAETLRDDFGYDFATSDYRDLIERKDIDIIDVCTPNNLHREQIVASLKAGKHVYADKPLCITNEEADEIVQVHERSGLIGQMAFHNRFYPWSKKIKSLAEEGFFGRIISFRATYYHSSNIKTRSFRGWKQDKVLAGGGTLVDMGSHALDLVYALLGEYERLSMDSLILWPERPDAEGNMVRVESEDHILLNVRMRSGAIGTIEVSKVIAGSNDDLCLELYGTDGALKFNSMDQNYVYVYDNRDPDGNVGSDTPIRSDAPIGGMKGFKAVETMNKDPESRSNFPGPRFDIGWLRGHMGSQYNFLTCVHENRPATPSLKDGAYLQKIMNRLYEVDNSGKPAVF
jgi:predicted dehydrogenase